ncbi:TRAP-type C4-dicarboxylate transport system, small permease component [Geosporobacter subterraneus DSM 17957]|uniref:TRAP-type C4-dicarboxylate transport system, small permease component n=1 Tax=Geosporobacter subterraneus DSM 17957 TaxID=1121919 RepID=A0A1M6HZX4_9FIRM|nr:TRAP transporter small permease [Geosporobacter subterraneus]SHJ27737.1 TRAP-type C4-dicarboxylate transport system, small permease component [Geosporobacter subterraneus DSM 17957]
MKVLKLLHEHIEEWILIATYTAMLVIATAQVFFRYVINLSLSWSQDLLTYMLIWSVFIGISLAVKKRKHIKVELAFVILSEKMQFYLKILSNLVFMLFCGIFSYYSLLKVYKLIFVNPQISESTGLPMWMIQIAVPFGFVLSIYRLIIDTKLLFKEKTEERNRGID